MKVWVISFAGLLLFACANVRTLNQDLDRLHSQVNILQREIKSTKNQVSDMRAKNDELKTDFSLLLDNLESEIRILSTSFEEHKEFLRRTPEEIYRLKEEIKSRLRLEERKGNQEQRFMEIEYRLRALDDKKDRQIIRINSWSNQ